MYMKEDGESESGSREEEITPFLEEDNEIEYPVNGKIFVTRHSFQCANQGG